MRTLHYFMAPDEPGSGDDPGEDPEADPDDPELPFEPLRRTPQGKYVISPTLAAALDRLAAPADDGQPVNHQDPTDASSNISRSRAARDRAARKT